MFLKSDMCTSEHIQQHLLKLHFQIVSQNCWSQSSAPFLVFVLYPRGNGEGVTEFVCLFFLSSFWITIRLQWWIHIFQTGWGCQPQTYLLAFFPKHCMKLKKKKKKWPKGKWCAPTPPPPPGIRQGQLTGQSPSIRQFGEMRCVVRVIPPDWTMFLDVLPWIPC